MVIQKTQIPFLQLRKTHETERVRVSLAKRITQWDEGVMFILQMCIKCYYTILPKELTDPVVQL